MDETRGDRNVWYSARWTRAKLLEGLAKLALLLAATGFLWEWPFKEKGFYLGLFSLFGAANIATVPGVGRYRVGTTIIGLFVVLGLLMLITSYPWR